MPELTVDVSALRDTETELVGLATTAVTEVIATTLGIASRNQCWGTDEIGGAFAHVYLGPAEEVLEAVQQVPYEIGSVGERFGMAATGYDDTEGTNTDEARTVEAEIGPGPGVSA